MNAIAPGVTNFVPQTLPCVTREGGFLEFSEDGPNRIDFNICYRKICLVIGNYQDKPTFVSSIRLNSFFRSRLPSGKRIGANFL